MTKYTKRDPAGKQKLTTEYVSDCIVELYRSDAPMSPNSMAFAHFVFADTEAERQTLISLLPRSINIAMEVIEELENLTD